MRHNSANIGLIQAAIEENGSQEPGEQLPVQEAADNHGVWRSTMQRRMAGQTVPQTEHTTNTKKLSPQQEDELVLYVKSLTARRLPPTRAMIQILPPRWHASKSQSAGEVRFRYTHPPPHRPNLYFFPITLPLLHSRPFSLSKDDGPKRNTQHTSNLVAFRTRAIHSNPKISNSNNI
jgi:hypothetical protein